MFHNMELFPQLSALTFMLKYKNIAFQTNIRLSLFFSIIIRNYFQLKLFFWGGGGASVKNLLGKHKKFFL